MKIVLLGANGQVASEVALLLHGLPGVDLVPVSRTRNGSAFLRSRGIPVHHGSVTDASQARRMLAGADVVANFALASGLGRAVVDANHAIIDASIDHAEASARIVFFSTLAVHGSHDATGGHKQTAYGDLKLRNERHFARRIRRSGRAGFVLRLGHVCGDEQNITHLIRSEITRGEVVLHDPGRDSNTTHVMAIAEALLAIGQGRAGEPGLYDCVNEPQWSWREVYEYEANRIGRPLSIRVADAPQPAPRPSLRHAAGIVFRAIDRLGARAWLERALPLLPPELVARIKASHSIQAARNEIAALSGRSVPTNEASFWPALSVRNLPGTRRTRQLIDSGAIGPHADRTAWPADLA